MPLPAIARHADGHFFVLAGVGDDRVLIQDPRETGPRTLDRTEFDATWSGEVILFARRAGLNSGDGRFGFGWFFTPPDALNPFTPRMRTPSSTLQKSAQD